MSSSVQYFFNNFSLSGITLRVSERQFSACLTSDASRPSAYPPRPIERAFEFVKGRQVWE